MPHLHTLELQEVRLPPKLDFSQFAALQQLHTMKVDTVPLPSSFDCARIPGLQRLELSNCTGLGHLANLASCSSLHVLNIKNCNQVSGLQQLMLVHTGTCKWSYNLDVPAVSPGLTHLDLPDVTTVDLALPGGAPRTALCHLGLHGGVDQVLNWDLPALTNLQTVDISRLARAPWAVGLSSTPGSSTAAVHLQTLDLTGCTALTDLNCQHSCRLASLDLSPVAASLTHLNASKCGSLTSVNLSGCTALRSLNVHDDAALTQLDLSDCVSLKSVFVVDCGVREVDVSACAALESVRKGRDQQVLGARPGVDVQVFNWGV